MYCPRLDHYVRLNYDGTFGRCGHMVNAPGASSLEQLDNSEWLHEAKKKMSINEWPEQCSRCRDTEEVNGSSVRLQSVDRHKLLHPKKNDYLIVAGTLDNVCNSACQTCNSVLSTKIGSLQSKNYAKTDNYDRFWDLPQGRILEVDVSGGEPTASKNYKKLLANLPANTKIVRMNTNGSRMIPELIDILERGIMVIVTISLDGIGKVHDYVRWPIKWEQFSQTVEQYLSLSEKYKLLNLDFWTTVSCLNVNDLTNITDYAKEKNIPHSWAYLNIPDVYNVRYKNNFTTRASHNQPDKIAVAGDNSKVLQSYIEKQDALRGIDIKDYLSF